MIDPIQRPLGQAPLYYAYPEVNQPRCSGTRRDDRKTLNSNLGGIPNSPTNPNPCGLPTCLT